MRERAWIVTVVLAAIVGGGSSVASAQLRGVQFTPDGKRTLVNKDVGSDRWAIMLDDDGSVSGNVFRSGGGDPAFIYCAPTGTPNQFDCFGADPCTDASGAQRDIQATPDDQRILAQKDVGTDRWAIALNFDDGTATGNVFRPDGDPKFLFCTPTGAPNTFDCVGADKCQGTPCAVPFAPIATVTLPASFFAVPEPCNQAFTPLATVAIPPSFFEPVATVSFAVGASQPIQAFQLRVSYPVAKGSFVGAGENVSCDFGGDGIFTKNDNDATGTLIFSVGNVSALTLPITVRCGFAALGSVAAGDFSVLVQEVTQNNAPGDTSVVTVAVGVD